VGSAAGSARSTTVAAISGLAGNTAARTGDVATGIRPLFNQDQARQDIHAQMAITAEFGKRASKAVGDYAGAQFKEAQRRNDQAGMQAWEEGGAKRVALHTLVGGLTGGAAGALGAGAASAAAPVIDQLQSQFKSALKDAGVGADAAQRIAGVAGGATAAAIGAAAGGSTGAAAAFNADMNNRQLHPSERQKAAELARKSGGKYTQAQIEDALRNSGNRALGESVIQGMVVHTDDPGGVYDTGAIFTAGAQGSNSIVQQLPDNGRVDPELAAFIQANTGGSNTPYHWSDVQLGQEQRPASAPHAKPTIEPAANGCVTAECAAGVRGVRSPIRDGSDVRSDVAAGALVVSRVAGIVGSAATAAAVAPGPHQPGAATTAVVATGVGFAADAVQQLAKPDVGKGVNDLLTLIVQERIDSRVPLAAPLTNELVEFWRQSGTSQDLQSWSNKVWSDFLRKQEDAR
jgi:hypothetical protein